MLNFSQLKKNLLLRDSLVAIFFFLLVFFLYKSIINVGFLSDDWHSLFIAANEGPVWKFFTTNIIGSRVGSTYAPMWNVLFAGEYALFGLGSWGFHLVSFLLVALGAFLLYKLSARLFNDWLVGFLAGSIFLLMPSQVESVAWISVQLHLLAAVLFLASLVAYERFSTSKKWKSYVLALFLAFLSLLTKEIGITFIAGFVLIDLYKKTPWKIVLKRLIAPVLLIGVYFGLRFYATGILFGYYAQAQSGKSLLEMMKMFIEMTVNLFFSYPERVIFATWFFKHLLVYILLAIIFLVGSYFIFKKSRKQLFYTVAMFLVTSFPLLSVAYNSLGNEGERYLYLPSFFAALLGAIYLRAIISKSHQVVVLSFCFLLLLGALSWPQISVKKNNWILAGQVVESGFKSYPTLSLPANAIVIFIGLPDHLQGAQMFRNATKEAINLLKVSPIKLVESERALMSPILTKDNFDQEIFLVRTLNDSTIQLIPTAGALITGLPLVQTKYGQATLLNFNKQYQTGEIIQFEVNKPALTEASKNGIPVFLVYFSAGSFRTLTLN